MEVGRALGTWDIGIRARETFETPAQAESPSGRKLASE